MYHYVRPFDSNIPLLNRLDFENFKKQLDFFNDNFGFINKKEFLSSIKNGNPVDGVLLTFDDGLICHYKYVYPELVRRNLWGIFYIPTLPLSKNRMLDVHKIHLLLGICESKVVYELLLQIINESDLIDKNNLGYRTLTYIDQTKDKYATIVKKILNYFIDYSIRDKIIDKLMKELIPNRDIIMSEFYLNKTQIKEMNQNGMIIGSHTINHPVLSKLSSENQNKEINDSFEFLKSNIGNLNTKTFCYPYGGETAYNSETLKILLDNNFEFSFDVDAREITSDDLLYKAQALPRYDCNLFPYGQCS